MASSKDIVQTSRPLTHRPSLSSNSLTGTNTTRQSHSRTNSHTVLTGPLNTAHRVARRKSVTSSNANIVAAAAAAAAIGDMNTKVPSLPINIGARRMSKSGTGGLASPPASMPAHKFLNMEVKPEHQDSAIDDQETASPEEGDALQNDRVRRASDGQPQAKEGRRFNRPELRCEHCGKGYKHSSCLTKHLWEHTPEWSYTSKLLISKHQQVQLLEAASVLVAMNDQPPSPPDSARETSPSVSGGSSEQVDGRSSANTTPPPHMDGLHATDAAKYQFSPTSPFGGDNFRSGISRSLYAAPSESSYATSVPFSSGFGHQYLEPSPPPSGLSVSGEANNLASRVAMLSCSYNSNNGSQAGQLHDGVPAVPPIPAHFLGQASLGQSPFLSSFPNQAPESFTRGDRRRGSEDVKMEYGDNDDDARSRARSDEYDVNDGFFGRMEE
ncbi:hypothetical protein N8I77_008065 [Diaporthe amygdali]|uniref:C2H2-type domain-containing protein n=1 Tax=Phomopsis amygdali TaxID=1214568 RepID=A0AAD9SDH1_PHOAM|nr:hypothetical protein N8I77_008065 [Diaporthe amygdali]